MTVDNVAGTVTHERVQFAGDAVMTQLLDYQTDSGFKGKSYDESMYYGGASWFSNLYAKARQYGPSVARVVRSALDATRREIKDDERFAKTDKYLGYADKGMRMMGYGNKKGNSKYI